MGSSIIFIGNSHPVYLPYWQNKRKVKYIDTEEFYHDLLTYCQTDINSKSSTIIKKLETKYKTKRLKDETIKRIHMSYREVLSGRKLNKRSIKLILNNELVASLEKHEVDARVIKSICQYQLLKKYNPKNKNSAHDKSSKEKYLKKEEINNQFYFDLSLLGKEQIELLKLDIDTRILYFNKRVKRFMQKYPNQLSEKEIRSILRAYRLNLRKANYQHEPLLFLNMFEKELADCGVNKGLRAAILANEEKMIQNGKKIKKVEKPSSKIERPKPDEKLQKRCDTKSSHKKSFMTKECFSEITDMARQEGTKALEDTHIINHSWIVKELSKKYKTSGLEKDLIFIIVAYQFYVYELEKKSDKTIEELLYTLETNLMDCGVPIKLHRFILDAEECYLQKKANDEMKEYRQKKKNVRQSDVKEEQTSQLIEIEESILKSYYRDLCALLIKIECYEEQDIIQALYRKYNQTILRDSDIKLLIDAYEYMVMPLANIRENNKRLQIIKTGFKQCLEAFEVKPEIIEKVWENEYGKEV
ncbi:hypothetical protein [Vagococcus bubulae]|uniref:hypothetical protein n=1 Tax=Vagococcus bubulae TaxID=1977868 RepID=UPI000F7F8D3C|nr:hypothetical protein [Vagococcus bubulae]